MIGTLLLYILICYGITTVLTQSYILKPIRPKHKFFHCYMCVGFWVGFTLCVFNNFSALINFDFKYFDIILMSFLSSGTSYFLGMLIDDEGLRIKK
jgi:hypothetical protein